MGRHLVGVVDAAGDHRVVGIATDEVDDDLLTDTRDVDEPPFVPGPGLADADQQLLFSSLLS